MRSAEKERATQPTLEAQASPVPRDSALPRTQVSVAPKTISSPDLDLRTRAAIADDPGRMWIGTWRVPSQLLMCWGSPLTRIFAMLTSPAAWTVRVPPGSRVPGAHSMKNGSAGPSLLARYVAGAVFPAPVRSAPLASGHPAT